MPIMSRWPIVGVSLALALSGCGLSTPDIQEFWGNSGDTDAKLGLIVKQVQCELRRAVRLVVAEDIEHAEVQGRLLRFFEDKWGADVLFQFTIDEKSSVNPGVALTPPLPNATVKFPGGVSTSTPQSKSFGFGAQLSSEGYRQDKLHALYRIADLVGPEKTLPGKDQIAAVDCLTGGNPDATLFLQSDLKFYEWLRSVMNVQVRREADLQIKNSFANQGVVVHDVKFEIVSSGNFTPSWKLVRVSANTGSSLFFSAGRDRTQEVIITLGPLGADGALKPAAQSSASSSELKAGIDSTVSRIGD
jgi:hypothetical protein